MVWGKIAKLNSINCDPGHLAGHSSTYDYTLYQSFKIASCILSRERDVSDSSLNNFVSLMRYALGKQTVANSLTSKYNTYTRERARMGRRADENGPAKALEIASYWDSINREARLIL